MRTLDLFSGIGGFALAAHWMGWETAAFVEWESFCQKVLNKNFPNTPIYGDITQFSYESERDRIGPIDLVCGGFPCQPFSHAGKRKGRDDERHLWPEMLRIIRESQPAFVVGENVAGLISMDGGDLLESICLDLEGEGYAVQPFIIPALSVGAPHRRDRIWIVAYRNGDDDKGGLERGRSSEQTGRGKSSNERKGWAKDGKRVWVEPGQCNCRIWGKHWSEAAINLCNAGMGDGIPQRLDINRQRAIGNAIVPQVAYEIFRAIQE